MLRPSENSLATCREVGVRHAGHETWRPRSTTFSLTPGKLIALIGPSGCGKSSLTLTLNGLIPHSVPAAYRGSVLIRGHEVGEQSIAQLATTVAMVLQDPDSQIVTTTVLDEVTWGLSNLRVPTDEIRLRARQALMQVGLLEDAFRNPWELSGGQRQRLVLASALAMRPALLVLDEPTANIDPASGQHLYRLLAEVAGQGTAVLVVEHDLDPVIGYVDEVIALDATGATLLQGPPRQVLHQGRDLLAEAGIVLPTCVRWAAEFPELEGTLTLTEGVDALRAHPAARHRLAAQVTDSARPAVDSPGLSVVNLSLRLGPGERRRTVLDGVSLHAPAGAVTAVIGVNGAGKSSLLSTLAGLHPTARVDSCRLPSGPLRLTRPDHRVGHVFQNPQHQFLHPTLREELAHAGRINRVPEEELQARVDAALADLALGDARDQSPFLLSGGQQRRLSVATALGEGREVLCLDEPTFGQDAASTRTLMDLLHRSTAQGTTIIMATHDLGLVLEHAAHVVLLHEGRVITEGRPIDVLTSPGLTESGLRPPPLLQLVDEPVEAAQPEATASSQPDEALSELPEPAGSRLGPLTLFLGVLPALFLVLTARRPEFALSCLALSSLFLLLKGRGTLGGRSVMVAALWLVAALLTWSGMTAYRFDLHGVSESIQVGPLVLDQGQWLAGLRSGVRIAALLALVLVSGTLTSPQDLLRSLTRTFRLPVRIAHAGMAATAFVERFRAEHRVIRQARHLRGTRAPRWLAPITVWAGSVIPLLVSAVRHAERVSMAMDARAFGAHRSRTELSDVRWRTTDTLALITLWATILAVALVLHHLNLLGRISLELEHHG
ncbi:ATP-binding cassette domain-containing protein [Arachnia propionica]|uniref:ATP-binding cassette domain-containing protein n=1 Tax=Arachnia propionica TaxID=1750 RepID=A0A3P1TAT7_9ACTN|nr:ATP-binding cassette domain-containing protein [Arachnia propionica]RRD06315.1 ATP-binding cassette domain-containing protein [Arachnia propionica]